MLDLCTGSGAIAIAINRETDAKTYAVDVSADAISLAKENAIINNANVEFVESDMFNNVIGKFDVIISNPPYIRRNELDSLQNEVKNFEPMLALDGGEDGLKFYKIIANSANDYLVDGGVLLLEVGYNQASKVKELLEEKNFIVEIIKDLENIDRVVKAVKNV